MLGKLSLAVKQKFYLQHDRVPTHSAEDNRQWLTATCPGKSIRYGGVLACSHRSLYLPPVGPSQNCRRPRIVTSGSSDKSRCQVISARTKNAKRHTTNCSKME